MLLNATNFLGSASVFTALEVFGPLLKCLRFRYHLGLDSRPSRLGGRRCCHVYNDRDAIDLSTDFNAHGHPLTAHKK